MVQFQWSDACRLAHGRDALISRRTLFESFDIPQGRLRELAPPSQAGVRPAPMRPDGAKPGNTEQFVDTLLGEQQCNAFPGQHFLLLSFWLIDEPETV